MASCSVGEDPCNVQGAARLSQPLAVALSMISHAFGILLCFIEKCAG
jgi:hypothetical protein